MLTNIKGHDNTINKNKQNMYAHCALSNRVTTNIY